MPNGYVEKLTPPERLKKMILLFTKSDITSACKIAWAQKAIRDDLVQHFLRSISIECSKVKSFVPGNDKDSSVDALKTFSVEKIGDDLKKTAPILYATCSAVVFRPDLLSKNKLKTEESLKPIFVNAIGTLFYIRSRNSNLMQSINSVTLRRGGTNKKSFTRLNHLGVCLSYNSALDIQTNLGKDNKPSVQKWFNELWISRGPAELTYQEEDVEEDFTCFFL